MSDNMGVGRKTSVTQDLIKKRIKYAVNLKLSGLTMQAVLTKINSEAEKEKWGAISMRQLRRDFAQHFSDNKLTGLEERDYNSSLRDIHMESMEGLMNKLQVRIDTKTDWQPYEYYKAMKDLFDMKAKYAEFQNWNYSKRLAVPNQGNQPYNINEAYDRASEAFKKEKPEVLQEFLSGLDELEKKLREEENASNL
jgi:hypothetical protein